MLSVYAERDGKRAVVWLLNRPLQTGVNDLAAYIRGELDLTVP